MNEELLRQIEQGKQEWEATLDAISDLICLLDENGRILRANRIIEKWQIISVKQVAGHSLAELIHPGKQDSYIQHFWQQAHSLLQAGQIAELEIEDTVLGRFLRLEAHPITNSQLSANNLAAFAVIVIRDITLEKQYERELAQQNQILQTLNQLSQDISATLNLDEVLNTAIKSAVTSLQVSSGYAADWDEENGTFSHITAYHLPQLPVQISTSEIKANVLNSVLFDDLARRISKSHEADVIQLNESSDNWRHLQKFSIKTVLRIPLQANGKKVGVLELWESRHHRQFTPIDIELALAIGHQIALAIDNARLYEQALIANRLKTALLANVSHELRTPLGVILIHAEMLQEGIYGSITSAQESILDETIANTQWLNRLVNDLIDQAQLETGQLRLNLHEFQPASLLHAVQSQVAVLAQAKGIQLNSSIAPHVPPILVGDSERIQQVFLNLATNAIKFTQEGQVQIAIFLADTAHWAIRVADTGIGISPKEQAFIFEPFRQVDGSATRTHGGSGLGLSIVKQLTELMNGQLLLESDLGQGSTFIILFPLES